MDQSPPVGTKIWQYYKAQTLGVYAYVHTYSMYKALMFVLVYTMCAMSRSVFATTSSPDDEDEDESAMALGDKVGTQAVDKLIPVLNNAIDTFEKVIGAIAEVKGMMAGALAVAKVVKETVVIIAYIILGGGCFHTLITGMVFVMVWGK